MRIILPIIYNLKTSKVNICLVGIQLFLLLYKNKIVSCGN